MTNIYVKKVLKNVNIFTIFYSNWCIWSIKAIKLLKQHNVKFKGYKIDKIDGGVKFLSIKFLENSSLNYDPNHLTRPIIFKDCKFLGGYSDLEKYFQTKRPL